MKYYKILGPSSRSLLFPFLLFFAWINPETSELCARPVPFSSSGSFISTRHLQPGKVAQVSALLALSYIFMASAFIPQNVWQKMDAHEHFVYLCTSGTPFDVATKLKYLYFPYIIFCSLYYSGSNHHYYSCSIYM